MLNVEGNASSSPYRVHAPRDGQNKVPPLNPVWKLAAIMKRSQVSVVIIYISVSSCSMCCTPTGIRADELPLSHM